MDNNRVRAHFGNAIRTRRGRLNISQEELAGRAGLHRTYVADIERGARNLSLESIQKLAAALGASLTALFSEVEFALAQEANDPDPSRFLETVDILLVEDDPEVAATATRELRRAKLQNRVHLVPDGAEALEFIFGTGRYAERKRTSRPQLILLDVHLPKVPGLEVLRRLKENPQTRPIPVVALVVAQDQRAIEESRRLGADAELTKPVDMQRLSEVTARLDLHWLLAKRS